MHASPELMLYAKIMLGFWCAMGVFSVAMTVRVLRRPVEATPEKFAKAKRTLLYSSWLVLPIVSIAVNAIARREYWMLLVSALLFSFILPVLVLYLRTRAAMRIDANQ